MESALSSVEFMLTLGGYDGKKGVDVTVLQAKKGDTLDLLFRGQYPHGMVQQRCRECAQTTDIKPQTCWGDNGIYTCIFQGSLCPRMVNLECGLYQRSAAMTRSTS